MMGASEIKHTFLTQIKHNIKLVELFSSQPNTISHSERHNKPNAETGSCIEQKYANKSGNDILQLTIILLLDIVTPMVESIECKNESQFWTKLSGQFISRIYCF